MDTNMNQAHMIHPCLLKIIKWKFSMQTQFGQDRMKIPKIIIIYEKL